MSTMIYSKSNIRKNKAAFLMLFLLICIALTLLISSTNSILTYKKVLLEKDKDFHDVHNLYSVPISEYRDEIYDFLANDPRIEITETEEMILLSEAIVPNFQMKIPAVILTSKDTARTIAPCVLLEEDQNVDLSRAIYLPIDSKHNMGTQLGDIYTIKYKSKSFDFEVAGFYDLLYLTRPANSNFRVFLSDEAMRMMEREVGKSIITSVRLHDINDDGQLHTDFLNYLKSEKIFVFENPDSIAINIQENLKPIEMPISTLSVITIIFAFAIILICVVVIGFRIANNIEESIQENGILRACGFTGKQLQHAMVTEYLILAIVAGCAGVLASIPVQEILNSILQSASGISLNLSITLPIALISVIFIIAIITVSAQIFNRKIKKLTPVSAFKGGISEKTPKGNQIPLSRGFGSLHWRLGVKGLFAYKKPYIISSVILCVISIILVICATFYLNMVVDTKTIEKMIGNEYGDISISAAPYQNANNLALEIEEIEGVRKTSMMDAVKLEVGDLEVIGYLSDDFQKFENFVTQNGDFPLFKNEIAITTYLANILDKQIGDTISVKIQGTSTDFLVTGLFTSLSSGSRFAALTEEAYKQVVPAYQRKSINVYLEKDFSVKDMIDTISARHGVLYSYEADKNTQYAQTKTTAEEKISNYMEFYGVNSVNYAVMHNGEIVLSGGTDKYQISEIIDSTNMSGGFAETFGTSISLLLILFSISSLLITVIILRVLINTLTNKRKEELTILRAVGFTSKQLSFQLANSFLPAVLFGTVAGCILGSVMMNPLFFTPMFSILEMSDIYFTAPPVVFIAISSILTIVGYFASLSTVYKIKKHSIVKILQTAGAIFVLCAMTLSFAQPFIVSVSAADTNIHTDSAKEEEEDVYPIASISKMYTTVSVMKLVEDGLIDLDVPIVNYFPEFQMADSRYIEITARMLLNHSAGLTGSSGLNTMLLGDTSQHEQVKQSFMDELSQQTLRYAPGERSIYCNDGFTLAEYLVEKVSGVSFTTFMQKNFFEPMQLENTGTVENHFSGLDIMPTYVSGMQTQTEIVYMVGSGGIYASAEDICRFSRIFTNDYSDGLLSKESIDEMAHSQHPGKMVPDDAETNLNYGLGWDAVTLYPFEQLGIKALSKNGNLSSANSNLIVLPDYNISVAVISSGGNGDSKEAILAGEILLAFAEEMDIIERPNIELPQLADGMPVTEDMGKYAGFYDFGTNFLADISFTNNSLIITTISSNDTRTNEYIHIGGGEFASSESGAELLGQSTAAGGVNSVVALSFLEDMNDVVHIAGRSYLDVMGLGMLANTMPIAQKIDSAEIPAEIMTNWRERSEYDYLLTNPKYSAEVYITAPIVRFHVYDQINGYIGPGNGNGPHSVSNNAVIIDENHGIHTQIIPTMNGANASNISFIEGEDALMMNEYRYISAKSLVDFSEIDSSVTVSSEAMWVKIDSESSKFFWNIQHGENTSFFIYDEDFNCVNHSLGAEPLSQILLPENGYIVFVSDGQERDFTIFKGN